MATGTNHTSATDNDYVMTITWTAACSVHGGLGSWTAAGTKNNRVPDASGAKNSADQAAADHAATCESGEW
jgi:hypothetical protein